MLLNMNFNLEDNFFIKAKAKYKTTSAVLFSFFNKKTVKLKNVLYVNNKKFNFCTLLKYTQLLKNLVLIDNLGFNFTLFFFVKGGGVGTREKLLEICFLKILHLFSKKYNFPSKMILNNVKFHFKRKERKKTGLKKARKSPQYHKR